MAKRFELFHVIADAPSARVRSALSQSPMLDDVTLRNVAYPEAEAAWKARGGTRVPALWNGQTLVEGDDAVLAQLGLKGS